MVYWEITRYKAKGNKTRRHASLSSLKKDCHSPLKTNGLRSKSTSYHAETIPRSHVNRLPCSILHVILPSAITGAMVRATAAARTIVVIFPTTPSGRSSRSVPRAVVLAPDDDFVRLVVSVDKQGQELSQVALASKQQPSAREILDLQK